MSSISMLVVAKKTCFFIMDFIYAAKVDIRCPRLQPRGIPNPLEENGFLRFFLRLKDIFPYLHNSITAIYLLVFAFSFESIFDHFYRILI